MSRHQRLQSGIVVLSLVFAVGALSAGKIHTVTSKVSTNAHQALPVAQPAPTPTTAVDPGATGIVTGAASPIYELDWYSVNGGGAIDATSASYKMGLTVGQPVAGEASAPSYKMGIGFWYGTGGCSCPDQGDVINNDAAVDVFDIIQEITIAFSGGADIRDPDCPTTRGDVLNNDAAVDVFDVIAEIGIAFSGGSAQNPCAP